MAMAMANIETSTSKRGKDEKTLTSIEPNHGQSPRQLSFQITGRQRGYTAAASKWWPGIIITIVGDTSPSG
jgi:hypothetical protein